MRYIHIIEHLILTEKGLMARHDDGSLQEVFLNQGSMDGACGYYSVFMCLIMNGLVRNKEARNGILKQDRRTSVGRLIKNMDLNQFFEGTGEYDIEGLFAGAFQKEIEVEVFFGNTGVEVRNFVEEKLDENHPVLIGVEFPESHGGHGHWLVAVGYEGYFDDTSEFEELGLFYVLDPGASEPGNTYWNDILDAKGTGGPYPYLFWGQETKVKISSAVAIKRV
jgi:hypothetical protein